jgi:acetyl-CoA acetyltransferase
MCVRVDFCVCAFSRPLSLSLSLYLSFSLQADAEGEPIKFPEMPVPATERALQRAGLTAAKIDAWEVNEAFSVVSLLFARLLKIDAARMNVNGGAVSLGRERVLGGVCGVE